MENTTLTYGLDVPEVAVDGQTVSIRDNGVVTIKFWQVREELENELYVDIVSAVRLAMFEDLKDLRDTIDKEIKRYETREE